MGLLEKTNSEDDFDYGEVVERAFDSAGWKFHSRKIEDRTVLSIPMSAKNCPGLNIKLDVSQKGDAKIRCYLAEDTPKSAKIDLIQVLNSLNNRYRYITLSLDSDGDILASYDFTMFSEDEAVIVKHAGTMVMVTSDIMDKCLPKIMKIIWTTADEEEEDEE